jgi:hypothetical protein
MAKLVAIQSHGSVESSYINIKFNDIFNPKNETEDTRTADDVICKIKDKVNKINSEEGD